MSIPSDPPNVGANVRRLRRLQKMTLDDLSARSGVSKSMLSQIERDQTNPTLATVWRLCESLGVSVESFFGREQTETAVEMLSAHATPSIRSADGRCDLRILGPLDLGGSVEWYEVRAEAGAELSSDPHEPGTMEHLTVLEGAMAIESGGERREVSDGETVRYRADQPHAICNVGGGPARALLVVVLRRPV
ncbi:MAG: XRE family transcriptional regulator [Rhodospirillales bacterium]|nr:XRE family transcriptional regulator [Rhodospirillales bacterium]